MATVLAGLFQERGTHRKDETNLSLILSNQPPFRRLEQEWDVLGAMIQSNQTLQASVKRVKDQAFTVVKRDKSYPATVTNKTEGSRSSSKRSDSYLKKEGMYV